MTSRVIKVLAVFIGVTAVGTIGYSLVEGWGFLDSLYMTMITITTTGYAEVKPLSVYGRIFTILFLMFGLLSVTFMTQHLIEGMLSIDFKSRRRRKMLEEIAKLEGHVILCGYGRMGKVIAKELIRAGRPFVAIDPDPENFKDGLCSEHFCLNEDATKDETLLKAGIKKASVLLCMVNSDAESLYITLGAHALNDKLYIISRAEQESARVKILRAGANEVILPVLFSGVKVAHTVLSPELRILEQLNMEMLNHDQSIEFHEVPVDDVNNLAGKSIRECGMRRKEMIIIGVRHRDGVFSFAPTADYVFDEHDTLITVCSSESVNNYKAA